KRFNKFIRFIRKFVATPTTCLHTTFQTWASVAPSPLRSEVPMFRFRIVLPLLIVGILTGGWLTGEEKDQPVKAKGTLPQNWKKLGLTDEQVQTVYRIQTKYRDQIGTFEAKIKELRKEEKGELDKVLTPAQKDRLREILLGESKDKDKAKVVDKDKPKDKDS